MRLTFRKRIGEDRALTQETLPPSFFGGLYPLEGPGDTELIPPSQALRIGTIFACVRLLADTAACLPLVAYRDTPQGRVRATGRLAQLLARPAANFTLADFTSTVVAHLALFGNAFVGKYRDESGMVAQIAPIHPAFIITALERGEPRYTLIEPMTGVSEHDASDIVHIKAMSPDGLLGMSPVQLCRQSLMLAFNLTGHAANFARNAGRVGGILRIPGWRTAQPGAADAVREDWESKFVGLSQSGRLLILTGEDDVQYQQLSLSMVDAQFVEQMNMSLLDLCRIFRVPPHLVGLSTGERLTYSNVEMEADEFLKFSLQPWLARIEQAISADTDLSPQTRYCRFDVSELLRSDTAGRATYYTAALNPQTGWLSRDEVRALEGYPLAGEN